jgi:tRNA 2-selenouridine synthase
LAKLRFLMHFILKWDLPVYFLDVPLEERTKHLVTTYASLSHDQLADAISRIAKRLGYDNAKFAQEELEKRNYYKVVEITLYIMINTT